MQPKETTAWWGEGFEKGIQTRVDAGWGSNQMERLSLWLKCGV